MRRERAPRPQVPHIDGYQVWHGRRLMHARFVGTVSQARELGRPWHVVAESAWELMRRAAGGLPDREVFGRW